MTVILKAVNTPLALKKVGFLTHYRFIYLSDYDHVDWATVPLDTYWDVENGKMEQLQVWVRSHSDSDAYELCKESSEDLYVEETPTKRKAKPAEKKNTKKSKSKRPKVDKSKAKPPKQTRQWVVPEEPTKRSTIPVGLLKMHSLTNKMEAQLKISVKESFMLPKGLSRIAVACQWKLGMPLTCTAPKYQRISYPQIFDQTIFLILLNMVQLIFKVGVK